MVDGEISAQLQLQPLLQIIYLKGANPDNLTNAFFSRTYQSFIVEYIKELSQIFTMIFNLFNIFY